MKRREQLFRENVGPAAPVNLHNVVLTQNIPNVYTLNDGVGERTVILGR